MSRIRSRHVGGGGILLLAIAGATAFAWPRPIPVDFAPVLQGRMLVTIDEEARTRVRHIYTVAAPVAGRVLRISHPAADKGFSIHVGDAVAANETVLAVMQPMAPSFLDIRSREELKAALSAADAAIKLAEAEVARIRVVLDLSRSELQRVKALAQRDVASAKALEKATADVDANQAALASAQAQLEVRRSERASIAARLIEPSQGLAREAGDCCVRVRAPVSGRVLRIVQESETVVQAGAPLIEIGDPADLEIVAELLSADAVRVQAGAAVRIDGWGGSPLEAQVTRIDPAGFLKVSALGIEEQRVKTIIDLISPRESWLRLGHDFRVNVHVVVWKGDRVLTLPTGSLFRSGESWAVYALRNGRAKLTPVTVGQRNARHVEIVAGLAAGDRVVLHPSDRIRDGVRVAERYGGR